MSYRVLSGIEIVLLQHMTDIASFCLQSVTVPLKPLTDFASKWVSSDGICSLQGFAYNSRKLLQLKQHVATINLQ